jgi:hypothetical protein
MTKTPFELRYELLMLAQGILSEQNINERIRLENDWNMECERARGISEHTHQPPVFNKFPTVPQYGADEVIKMAEKLNEFVSKNT